ncbi:uncharacterized protein LOC130657479 [Hydractinia symbiolongicarpus]|uniref:uncharacterized protein LOC130657479 n=1 Tax=Hydractinia symbiolongicarpus TaxID=13093 RepID=UPI00254D5C03|nr:uncharacterized protein LOC130657479 [Hydractinia symbiolongicarpus]
MVYATLTILLLELLKYHEAGEFPAKEFFGSESGDVQYHLCSNLKRSKMCCSCSVNCMRFKTCCIDRLWDGARHDRLQPYLQHFLNESEKFKNLSCEPILTVSQKHTAQSYFMVRSCLQNAKKLDVERCLHSSFDIDNDIPALGNDTYLYKNSYCAKCNFVFAYNFIDIQAKCENASELLLKTNITRKDLNNLSGCEFSVDIGSNHRKYFQECKRKEMVCPHTDRFYRMCNTYGEAMGKYKNYHCAMCAHNQITRRFNTANRTVIESHYLLNRSVKLANFTKRDLQRPYLATPIFNLTCETERCRDQHCFLLKGAELSRYLNTFLIGLSKNNGVEIKHFKHKFPIRQFLNIPKDYVFDFDRGLEQYLCNAVREKCCNCNDKCMEEKNCCIDKFWNETVPESLDSYLNQFIQKWHEQKLFSCQPVFRMPSLLNRSEGLMVKSCLSNTDSNDVKRCLQNDNDTFSDIYSTMPVNGSDGHIYKNSFCAKCNFVTKYTPINVSAICNQSQETSVDSKNSLHNCLVSITQAANKSRVCKYEKLLRKDCSRSGNYFELCNAYKGGVGDFRNYHCWLCNQTNYTSPVPPVRYCDTIIPILERSVPSILITFTRVEEVKTKNLCELGKMYDSKTMKCEKVICPPGSFLNGDLCVVQRLLYGNRYSLNTLKPSFIECFCSKNLTLYITLKSNFNESIVEILQPFEPYLPEGSTARLITNKTVNSRVVYALTNVNKNISNLVDNNMSSSNVWQNIENLVIAEGDKLRYTEHYKLNMSHYFPRHGICALPIIYNADESFFTSSCIIKKGDKTFYMNNISTWIYMDKTETRRLYSICLKFHLHLGCPQRKINGNVSFNNNGNLLHIRSGDIEIYKVDEYLPLPDGYGVCIKSSSSHSLNNDNNRLNTVYDIAYYISLTGTCLSMACYISIMLSFYIFKEIRTVPGLNTLGMCLSLFIADAMFLLATHSNLNGKPCRIIAVALHWCLLSAFMWNLIIAWDMISTFGSFKVASRDNNTKKFIRRCGFSLVPSTLIVSLSLILEETSTVDIGYGVNRWCWITGFYARLVFYIIPVAVIFLITLSTLLCTIRKIHRDFKGNEEILKTGRKTKKETIKIAVKLGIILGITEGLGFIQIAKSNLSYNEKLFNAYSALLYSTCRSFRGLMLCLVYIVGANVITLYRKRVRWLITTTDASKTDDHKWTSMPLNKQVTTTSF